MTKPAVEGVGRPAYTYREARRNALKVKNASAARVKAEEGKAEVAAKIAAKNAAEIIKQQEARTKIKAAQKAKKRASPPPKRAQRKKARARKARK